MASVFARGFARMAVLTVYPSKLLTLGNTGTPTTVTIANVQAQQSWRSASKAGRTTRQQKTNATAVQPKQKAIPHLARAREATAEAVVSTRGGRRARATAPGVHAEDTKNVLRKVPSRRSTVNACAVQAGPHGIRLAATLRVQQMARQPNAPRPLDTSEIAGFFR